MAVLFPDGTIRYGMYCGTSDRLWPRLFDTLDEAWDSYRQTDRDLPAWASVFLPCENENLGIGEKVQIFVDYGYGTEWTGTATRSFITSEYEWSSDDSTIHYREFRDKPHWLDWRSGHAPKGTES